VTQRRWPVNQGNCKDEACRCSRRAYYSHYVGDVFNVPLAIEFWVTVLFLPLLGLYTGMDVLAPEGAR